MTVPADGQYPNSPLQTAEQFGRLRLRGRTWGGRGGPRSAQQYNYEGALTRPERLRQIFPLPSRRRTRSGREFPPSPVRSVLETHNLLAARSMIAKRVVGRYGRASVSVLAEGSKPSIPEAPPPAIGQFDDSLSVMLQNKADEAFDVGLGYFRDQNWAEADNWFSLVRSFEFDRPRAYVADVFVSFNRESYNQAMGSLLRAADLARKPDDLKIDRFIERMYNGENSQARPPEFVQTVEAINLLATANPDAAQVSLLQAYFAWLNGDPATSRNALDRAAKILTDEQLAKRVQKFRELVTAGTDSPVGAPSSE